MSKITLETCQDLYLEAIGEIRCFRAIIAVAERDLSDTQEAMAEIQAINAELVAALEEVKQFLKPALPYPERDRLFALVGAAIARAKP